MALDGGGNLYVSDTDNHRIRRVTPSGATTTVAGTGNQGETDGTGDLAAFNFPGGLAIDRDGNVYVAEHRSIRVIRSRSK